MFITGKMAYIAAILCHSFCPQDLITFCCKYFFLSLPVLFYFLLIKGFYRNKCLGVCISWSLCPPLYCVLICNPIPAQIQCMGRKLGKKCVIVLNLNHSLRGQYMWQQLLPVRLGEHFFHSKLICDTERMSHICNMHMHNLLKLCILLQLMLQVGMYFGCHHVIL